MFILNQTELKKTMLTGWDWSAYIWLNTEWREDNFLVGLTNNPPSTMPPTNYSYTTCGQWPGSAPAAATMFVRCTDNLPPSRYVVIIQQYQPRQNLQICELEVYQKGYCFIEASVILRGYQGNVLHVLALSKYINKSVFNYFCDVSNHSQFLSTGFDSVRFAEII